MHEDGKKSLGQLSKLEYLDWYILHEPEYLKNHEVSPQVNLRIFISFVTLSNLRCSSLTLVISFLNLKIKNSQTQLISSVL